MNDYRDLIITSYGLDPGLRHGALVKGRFLFAGGDPSRCSLVTWSYQKKWTPGDELSLSEKSTPQQVADLTAALIRSLEIKGPIGIDWDPTSVFWRSRKIQAVKLAFFMGYFYNAAQVNGYVPVFITPSMVRTKLDVDRSADKDSTWSAFLGILDGQPASQPSTKKGRRGDPFKDGRDALILAFLVARGIASEYYSQKHTRLV